MSKLYDSFVQGVLSRAFDFIEAPMKCALISDEYVFSASHGLLDVLACEVGGDGYAAQPLTGRRAMLNLDGSVSLVVSAPAWVDVTLSARYCVVYFDDHSDAPLVGLFDLGSVRSVTNGTLCVNFSPFTGLISVRAE